MAGIGGTPDITLVTQGWRCPALMPVWGVGRWWQQAQQLNLNSCGTVSRACGCSVQVIGCLPQDLDFASDGLHGRYLLDLWLLQAPGRTGSGFTSSSEHPQGRSC